MTWIDKLKHEWKTFAWAVATGLLEIWDQVLAAQIGGLGTVIPPDYQWIVNIVIPVGFLVLRRWVHKDEA